MKVNIEQAYKVFNPPIFDRTDIWQGTEGGTLSVKLLFLTLYKTCLELGYKVGSSNGDISINWGGRINKDLSNVLYFEHAWGPRNSYQFSPTGVNYNHYCVNSSVEVTNEELVNVRKYRDSVLRGLQLKLTGKSIPINSNFVLVPLQSPRNNYFSDVKSRFSEYANDKSDTAYWNLSQEIIDSVEELNLDYPVIYLQDPRDHRSYADELSYKKDSLFITSKDGFSLHDFLASKECKLVAGINTNALNEAIFWERDVISFGELVDSSANRLVPNTINEKLFSNNPEVYWQYMTRLYRNTWSLADFSDPLMVSSIFETKGKLDRIEIQDLVYG